VIQGHKCMLDLNANGFRRIKPIVLRQRVFTKRRKNFLISKALSSKNSTLLHRTRDINYSNKLFQVVICLTCVPKVPSTSPDSSISCPEAFHKVSSVPPDKYWDSILKRSRLLFQFNVYNHPLVSFYTKQYLQLI
jgi:hypothetical protein